MKLPRLLLFICCTYVIVHHASSFQLPRFDDIAETFSNLARKVRSTPTDSASDDVTLDKNETPRIRSKRQTSNIGDESPHAYEIRSSSLPLTGSKVNTRYMPSIGNGYIGATIYDNSIFLNGVYAGSGADSHRASIPALLMGRLSISNTEIDKRASRKYTLNALEGYFMESIDCEYGIAHHKMYMHQKYIRLFVVDTYAKLKPGSTGGLVLNIKYPPVNSSVDMTFGEPVPFQGGSWKIAGRTRTAEEGEKTHAVNVFYTEPLEQIPVLGNFPEINYTQVMAIDTQLSYARREFEYAQDALKTSSWNFFQEHVEAWRKTWEKGHLEVSGGSDTQLMKAVWFAQYYLLSSLPSHYPSLPPPYQEPFFGLGRTGIGKGKLHEDYQGHVMYDNEYYLLPAVLPFHPQLAKAMLRYRSATAAGAEANAQLHGGVGYHYPWESGTSGAELARDSCPEDNPRCHWNRIFVTAGVAYAIRLYYSMTRDLDYMVNTIYSGCDVSREVAKFLANQIVYNPEHGRYDINGITGPDEFHQNVNNNAFTLCAVSLAIHWARYFSCMCEKNERVEVPDEYIQKALYLNLPYDNIKRLHYAHEGYDPETDGPIKQADTIMLNYPLNWNYSVDIMKNDLDFYELLMSDRTPAMTWSWFTIGWKWVGEDSKMRSYFLKSYQDYIVQPFKIWTEYTERNPSDQRVGNVNFLPGMGAFLQSIIYGFAGFRIRPDKLEIHNPIPPPGAKQIKLVNLYYLGTNMTFTVTEEATTVEVISTTMNKPISLILRRNVTGAVEESLTPGETITINKAESNGFFIYPEQGETCEHPRDYIYMPWGYSPWIDRAPTVHRPVSALLLVAALLVVTVISRF